MSWVPETEERSALIQREAKALPAPAGASTNTRKSFSMMARRFVTWIQGYTVDDINRLKEGGVQLVEGKGQTAIAEAKAKIGEAAEHHAKAEHELAQANKANAEAYAIRKKAEGDYLREQSEAFIRVQEAISRIKQQGGTVAFDEKQLLALVAYVREEPQKLPEPPSADTRIT
jgi:hypothetical protein